MQFVPPWGQAGGAGLIHYQPGGVERGCREGNDESAVSVFTTPTNLLTIDFWRSPPRARTPSRRRGSTRVTPRRQSRILDPPFHPRTASPPPPSPPPPPDLSCPPCSEVLSLETQAQHRVPLDGTWSRVSRQALRSSPPLMDSSVLRSLKPKRTRVLRGTPGSGRVMNMRIVLGRLVERERERE